jgi:Protease inhibitor Inh
MLNLRSLSLAAALSFASVAMAHADGTVTGAWKLSIGTNDAPCSLTFTADAVGNAGTAVPAGDCQNGLASISHWKAVGPTLQLYSSSDELVAWLKPKGDAYAGSRISDGRQLALNR